MQLRSRFTLVAAAALVACAHDHPTAPAEASPPPVRLKDVVLSSLPSPLYHFEYDAGGRIRAISYASELASYDVTYVGDRITEITSHARTNPDRLQYEYDNAGRVAAVKYVNDSGVFTVVFLTYDGPRLAELERSRRVTGGYIIDKTMTMKYDGAGNLRELITHRPAIDGAQTEVTTVDQFQDYDAGINVDGFSVIHDEFFDQLILLPGVQLQKTNPRHVSHSGGGMDFVVDYSYSYDEQNRPIARTGNLAIVSGDQAGKVFVISAQYSYY
jgi:hypothetical protein